MTRIVGRRDRPEFVWTRLRPCARVAQSTPCSQRLAALVEGVEVRALDIEGLLKTKTDSRDKDRIDREALERLRKQLQISAPCAAVWRPR